jgi:hypothetical protein
LVHLDSQTPNIEFVTQDPGTGNTMSCRLFATDLAYESEESNRVAFKVEKYEPDTAVDRNKPNDEPEHEGLQIVERMSQSFQKTCVIRVTLGLNAAKERTWEGISASDLAAIRRGFADTEVTDADAHEDIDIFMDEPEDTRNNIVKILDTETRVELFFTCKMTKGAITVWTDKFAGYARELLTYTKQMGNFWFYRAQLLVATEDKKVAEGQTIEQPELADID